MLPLVILDECVDYMASYQAKEGVWGLFGLYSAQVENDRRTDGTSTYEGALIPFCIYLDQPSFVGLRLPTSLIHTRRPSTGHDPNATSTFTNAIVSVPSPTRL